ncbi:MAG TPA: hypothetical protein VGL35_14655 [Rhizomicrobium sp.]|jgi:hypothetical protein
MSRCRASDLVRIIEFLRAHAGIRETSTRLICMELSSVDGALPDTDAGE